MAINWFPGHMHKTQKALRQQMSQVDIVIELLDARAPVACQNPLLQEIRADRPYWQLLNKTDLADPAVTDQWLAWYQSDPIPAASICAHDHHFGQLFEARIQQFVSGRGTADKPIRLMIIGLPNVGKSTLLNHWLGRKINAIGDTPAVTRDIKRIKLKPGWVLYDTPGVMWTKLPDQQSAYRLALINMIKETAFDIADAAAYLIEFCLQYYPAQLQQQYSLSESDLAAQDEIQVMEQIARRRGCWLSGQVQWQKLGQLIVQDFRSGALGRISLEMPEIAFCSGSR